MKTFALHWKDGRTELVYGCNIADACNNAGIGGGALPALDYYEEINWKSLSEHPAKSEEERIQVTLRIRRSGRTAFRTLIGYFSNNKFCAAYYPGWAYDVVGWYPGWIDVTPIEKGNNPHTEIYGSGIVENEV